MTAEPLPAPDRLSTGRPRRLIARTPADLVAFVPVAIGFVPEHSLVMLSVSGAEQFHGRVDLPERVEHVGRVVDVFLRPAIQHAISSVVFIAYAPESTLVDVLVEHATASFAAAGITVVDALRVHDGRCYPMLPGAPAEAYADGEECPTDNHRFAVEATVAGRVVHASRSALAATLAPDETGRAEVRDVLSAPDAFPVPTPEALARVLAWWQSSRESPDALSVARLTVACLHPDLRDALWSRLDRSSAPAAVELWSDVVRRAPAELVSGPASVLAVAAWLAGDGALAWCAIDLVDPDLPGGSLARLVADLLDSAVPPRVWEVVARSLRS